MTDKEAKEIAEINKNQKKNSDNSLITQLLLHLIDKYTSLSTEVSKTEVSLIKWMIGTDIALAGIIIAAVHYFIHG